MNNVSYISKEDCSGCTCCEMVCPKHAISMMPDALGFLYPNVNQDSCIDCGLCVKKCSFNSSALNTEPLSYFAFRLHEKNELIKSQSGGAFYAIAHSMLKSGCIIYGVMIDNEYVVCHKRSKDENVLNRFRYSKYVQSYKGDIFKKVLHDLDCDKVVLFSGTSCEIAGLKSFIPPQKQHNLYTIDVICRGVSSPSLWKDYTQFVKNKYGNFNEVVFRDKESGWNTHNETFVFRGVKKHFKTFATFYHNYESLRLSCYNCHFASTKRVSDLTIGDFWNWKKFHHEYNDDLGMSQIMVNTGKGEYLLDIIKRNNFCLEVTREECIQEQLINHLLIPKNRMKLEEDYITNGFLYVAKKYSNLGVISKLKDFLRPFYYKLRNL